MQLGLDQFAPRPGSTPGDKISGMGVTVELQNLGDAQLCRDITSHIEHAFADRRGDWRVSIAGSRASKNWQMRVEAPNGFERTYTLESSAGQHQPETIRRLILHRRGCPLLRESMATRV